VRSQASAYRYRRGCFQLNLALSARPALPGQPARCWRRHQPGTRRRRPGDVRPASRSRPAAAVPVHLVARADRGRPDTGSGRTSRRAPAGIRCPSARPGTRPGHATAPGDGTPAPPGHSMSWLRRF
jgi:hypothetical protein